MALHSKLLELEKDSSVLAKHQDTPFLLSLRDSQEFSSLHSFGLLRVPHIGVYGSEYTVCSPVALLSLPAVPRVLKQLPPELISALDLDTALKGGGGEPYPPSIFRPPTLFSPQQPSEAELVSVARALVAGVLELALRKVTAERKTRKSKVQKKVNFLGIGCNYQTPKTHFQTETRDMEISVNIPIIQPSSFQMDTSVSIQAPNHFVQIPSMVCTPDAMVVQVVDMEEEAEMLDVAKRLVLKCIRSACHTLEAEQEFVDPIDDLISSTKRMRISSPSPYSSEEEEADLPLPQAPPSPEEHEKLQPEIPERSLTPESMKMQNKRKKRGRSDSHEVNSLVDYDTIRRRFGSRAPGLFNTSITEVEEGNEEEEADTLTSLVRMMTIDEVDPPSSSEGTMGKSLGRNPGRAETKLFTKTNTSPTTYRGLGSNNPFPPSYQGPPTTNRSDPCSRPRRIIRAANVGTVPHKGLLPTHTGPVKPANMGTVPPTEPPAPYYLKTRPAAKAGTIPHTSPSPTYYDLRKAANVGAVPEMDLYMTIHSCPPSNLCQKFLCYNTNEINLMYHCWLFGDVSCDPHVTVTDNLEVGVFDPCRVQAVHMELQDAGAPFHFLDQRTVCIHNCCFSPNNAQLQLQESDSFHTFFSAARHRERRAVTLHILPATTFVEKAVREGLTECHTLKHMLYWLNSMFPEIASKISGLISAL